MAGKEGDIFRRVLFWSIAVDACHVRHRVPAVDGDTRLDGGRGEVSAAPCTASPLAERDLTPLVAELRAAVGDEWVYTQEHQLRTYESDGLLQYHVIPAAAVLPGSAEEVQAVVRACAAGRRAVGGARRGLGPLGRRAADRRRHPDRALAPEARARRRPREPARVRRAGRHEPRGRPPRSRPTSSTRPTRRARSSARSAATWPRTPAARTASSTASRRTTSAGSSSCCPTAR